MTADQFDPSSSTVGDHRRRRRGTIAVVAVVSLLLGAGVVAAASRWGGSESGRPSVAATSSSTARPDPTGDRSSTVTSEPSTRRVTAQNLMTADDVPVEDSEATAPAVARDGTGRPLYEMSVCWATVGRADLRPINSVQRNFRYEIVDPATAPDAGPLTDQPVIYTQALQFADPAAANKARDIYAGWLARCATELDVKGYGVVPELGFSNQGLSVDGGSARVSEVVYQRPGGTDGDNAFWESVGLTLVGDRLMVTVFLHFGEDFNVSFDQSEGDLEHPQLALVEAAAERLAV